MGTSVYFEKATDDEIVKLMKGEFVISASQDELDLEDAYIDLEVGFEGLGKEYAFALHGRPIKKNKKAIGCLTSEEVKKSATLLNKLTFDEVWDAIVNSEQGAICSEDYLAQFFDRIKKLFKSAAKTGHGIYISLP